MNHTLKSSCFSFAFQDPLHKQGFYTSLQPSKRWIKISNLDEEKKYGNFVSQKISAACLKQSFSSNCRDKPTEDINLLGQTLNATAEGHEFVIQPTADDHKNTLQNELWKNWDVFYRFCRPHSVAGTITGVISISLLPLTSFGDLSPAFFLGVLKALIPYAFVNLYVTTLNQVTDVHIDKINKPYLPLVSGEYTMGQGKAIAAAFGSMCLAMGIIFQSPPLFMGVLVHFLLLTAYCVELPLLRWKTNPFLAALCIICACAPNLQLPVFIHIQKYVLGRPIVFTKSVGFTLVFFSLFALVLAVFKDIPDEDGDRAFGNQTFVVKHGKKKMFTLCMSILFIAYGSAVVVGASSSSLLNKLVSVIGNCTLASILWFKASSLDINDDPSTESFYMFLWKLFRAEYLLIHFMR